MTLLPGKCPKCLGKRPDCETCGGTGVAAFTIPDSGPMFTRRCPDCGWTNGAYLPQPGMWVPTDGAQCSDEDGDSLGGAANFCMQCEEESGDRQKAGHMVWQRLDDGEAV